MIFRLCREFSAKAAPERAEALSRLMAHPVMQPDFTSANVSGDAKQVLILANPGACLMLARESKGHRGIEASALEGYVGCCVHDHDVTFYSYGTSHQECMQHNVRYLTGSVQNEPKLTWNRQMLALVGEMLHWRGSLDAGAVSQEELEKEASVFEGRYDEVLALAASEYEKSLPTKYYREGYNLFLRFATTEGASSAS